MPNPYSVYDDLTDPTEQDLLGQDSLPGIGSISTPATARSSASDNQIIQPQDLSGLHPAARPAAPTPAEPPKEDPLAAAFNAAPMPQATPKSDDPLASAFNAAPVQVGTSNPEEKGWFRKVADGAVDMFSNAATAPTLILEGPDGPEAVRLSRNAYADSVIQSKHAKDPGIIDRSLDFLAGVIASAGFGLATYGPGAVVGGKLGAMASAPAAAGAAGAAAATGFGAPAAPILGGLVELGGTALGARTGAAVTGGTAEAAQQFTSTFKEAYVSYLGQGKDEAEARKLAFNDAKGQAIASGTMGALAAYVPAFRFGKLAGPAASAMKVGVYQVGGTMAADSAWGGMTQIVQNKLAQGTYDPKRATFEGVGEAMLGEAIGGAFVDTGIGAIAHGGMRNYLVGEGNSVKQAVSAQDTVLDDEQPQAPKSYGEFRADVRNRVDAWVRDGMSTDPNFDPAPARETLRMVDYLVQKAEGLDGLLDHDAVPVDVMVTPEHQAKIKEAQDAKDLLDTIMSPYGSQVRDIFVLQTPPTKGNKTGKTYLVQSDYTSGQPAPRYHDTKGGAQMVVLANGRTVPVGNGAIFRVATEQRQNFLWDPDTRMNYAAARDRMLAEQEQNNGQLLLPPPKQGTYQGWAEEDGQMNLFSQQAMGVGVQAPQVIQAEGQSGTPNPAPHSGMNNPNNGQPAPAVVSQRVRQEQGAARQQAQQHARDTTEAARAAVLPKVVMRDQLPGALRQKVEARAIQLGKELPAGFSRDELLASGASEAEVDALFRRAALDQHNAEMAAAQQQAADYERGKGVEAIMAMFKDQPRRTRTALRRVLRAFAKQMGTDLENLSIADLDDVAARMGWDKHPNWSGTTAAFLPGYVRAQADGIRAATVALRADSKSAVSDVAHELTHMLLSLRKIGPQELAALHARLSADPEMAKDKVWRLVTVTDPIYAKQSTAVQMEEYFVHTLENILVGRYDTPTLADPKTALGRFYASIHDFVHAIARYVMDAYDATLGSDVIDRFLVGVRDKFGLDLDSYRTQVQDTIEAQRTENGQFVAVAPALRTATTAEEIEPVFRREEFKGNLPPVDVTDPKNINQGANIRRGWMAARAVMSSPNDVSRAMYKPGLGWVGFLRGSKDTFGIEHVVDRRRPGLVGEALMRQMVHTLAKGIINRPYLEKGVVKVNVTGEGATVVLALANPREPASTYVVTAFANNERTTSPYGQEIDWNTAKSLRAASKNINQYLEVLNGVSQGQTQQVGVATPDTAAEAELSQDKAMAEALFRREAVEDGSPRLIDPRIYFKSQKVVEDAKLGKGQDAATVDQWRAILKNGGVKAEEMYWTGLSDFLDASEGVKLSRQDILDHLNNGTDLTIHEVEPRSANAEECDWNDGETKEPDDDYIAEQAENYYYDDALQAEVDARFDEFTDDVRAEWDETGREYTDYEVEEEARKRAAEDERIMELALNEAERQATESALEDAPVIWTDRTHGYEIVGNRDMGYTVTDADGAHVDDARYLVDAKRLAQEHVNEVKGGQKITEYESHRVPGGTNYREFLFTLNAAQQGGPAFEAPHFTESNQDNILFHVRTTDRMTAVNGQPRKMLFVEEIQSDWHQHGRDYGYRDPGHSERRAKNKDMLDIAKGDLEALYDFDVLGDTEAGKPGLFPVGDPIVAQLGAGVERQGWSWVRALFDRDPQAMEMLATAKAVLNDQGTMEDAFQVANFQDGDLHGDMDRARAFVEADRRLQEAGIYDKAQEIRQRVEVSRIERDALDNAVPDAPLKDTKAWASQAIKRMILVALDEGYDMVGLSTAQPHIKRWGTQRAVWQRNSDGSYTVNLDAQVGGNAGGINLEDEAARRNLLDNGSHTVSNVHDLFYAIQGTRYFATGNDKPTAWKMAQSLWRKMTGSEADHGVSMPRAEGMAEFYDRVLPKLVEDAGKLVGVKAHLETIEFGTGRKTTDHFDASAVRAYADAYYREMVAMAQQATAATEEERAQAITEVEMEATDMRRVAAFMEDHGFTFQEAIDRGSVPYNSVASIKLRNVAQRTAKEVKVPARAIALDGEFGAAASAKGFPFFRRAVEPNPPDFSGPVSAWWERFTDWFARHDAIWTQTSRRIGAIAQTPTGEWLGRQFRRPVNARIAAGLEGVVGEDFHSRVGRLTGRRLTELGRLLDNLDAVSMRYLAGVLRGEYTNAQGRRVIPAEAVAHGLTPNVARDIRTWINTVHQEVNQDMSQSAHTKPGDLVGYIVDYFPQRHNYDGVFAGNERAGMDPNLKGLSREDVGMAFWKAIGLWSGHTDQDTKIRQMLNNIRGQGGMAAFASNVGAKGLGGYALDNAVLSRVLHVDPKRKVKVTVGGKTVDVQLGDLMDNDTSAVLVSYATQMTRSGEFARRFGPRGEEIKAAFAKIDQERAAAGLPPLTNAEVVSLENAVRANLGILHRDFAFTHPGIFNAMQWMSTVTNWMTLSLATVASVPELMMPSVRLGWRGQMYALQSGLKSLATIHGVSKDRALAHDLGVIIHPAHNSLMSVVSEGGHLKPHAWNQILFRATMLTRFTEWTETMAVSAASRMIPVWAKKAAKGDAHAVRWLREVGLTSQDVAGYDPDNHYQTTNEKVDAAIYQMAREMVISPDAGEKAAWQSDPRFMLVRQIKSYMTGFNNTVLQRMGREAAHGNVAPIIYFAMMSGLAAAAYWLREQLTWGNDGNPALNKMSLGKDNPMRWLYIAIDRGGILGPLQIPWNMLSQTRLGQAGTTGALVPAAGVIETARGSLAGLLRYLANGGQSPNDWRAFIDGGSRLIPFLNSSGQMRVDMVNSIAPSSAGQRTKSQNGGMPKMPAPPKPPAL